MPRRLLIAASLLVAPALLAAGCGGDGGDEGRGADGTTESTDAAPVDVEPVDLSGRGPYAVGQIDLQFDAEHTIAVFYPVDADAVPAGAEPYSYSGEDVLDPAISALLPASLSGRVAPDDTWVGLPASGDGPFPTVLHSHGFSGNLRFANRHNAAVASWGYVVAAVDHPERGLAAILDRMLTGPAAAATASDEYLDSDQLIAALDLLADPAALAGTPLEGAVDTERVAAEGHSAGGSASGTAAYDPRVDLWIGQAPAAPIAPGTDLDAFTTEVEAGGQTRRQLDTAALLGATDPPAVPSLVIAAEGDSIIPLERVEQTFAWLAAPKRLVVIAGSGHAVFVDPCLPIRQEGGLSGFVRALGLDPAAVPLVELGENGCLPTDVDPEQVWGLIDHVTVAQLDLVFGRHSDVAEASLDPSFLDATFPGLVREVEAS